MSLRKFTIIGDSNVMRHMNHTNRRDRPQMLDSELIPCGQASRLAEALDSVREETNVVLVSCLTNFLISSEEAGSLLSFRIEPVLQEVLQVITKAAQSSADRHFVVSAPMYRSSPEWYQEGMPEILNKYYDIFKSRPKNVLLAPGFPTPKLESDGVHLIPYSGLEFVLHLFDSANSALDSPVSETECRALDRITALQQDHDRLSKIVATKTAGDSELLNVHDNIRERSDQPNVTATSDEASDIRSQGTSTIEEHNSQTCRKPEKAPQTDSPGPSAPCDPPAISEGAANDRPLAKKTKKNKPFRCNLCPKRLHSYDSCNRHICAQHYKEALEAWVGEDNTRCRECGKPYKDTTSLLVHAARQHQVQGVNLPSRNEMIGVIDTSLQAEASMSGHGAISDAPPSETTDREKKRKQENSIGAGGKRKFQRSQPNVAGKSS